jgi:hypothetical protein
VVVEATGALAVMAAWLETGAVAARSLCCTLIRPSDLILQASMRRVVYQETRANLVKAVIPVSVVRTLLGAKLLMVHLAP